MEKSKPVPPAAPKRVWRISADAPQGAWVDPRLHAKPKSTPDPALGELPEVSSGGWVISSFDLLNGTDISEAEDTVPGDLFDELFPQRSESPKPK
ncbi:MAG: hypothetical protein ABIQ60_06290 [Burkholderiaceae bacterium]